MRHKIFKQERLDISCKLRWNNQIAIAYHIVQQGTAMAYTLQGNADGVSNMDWQQL